MEPNSLESGEYDCFRLHLLLFRLPHPLESFSWAGNGHDRNVVSIKGGYQTWTFGTLPNTSGVHGGKWCQVPAVPRKSRRALATTISEVARYRSGYTDTRSAAASEATFVIRTDPP